MVELLALPRANGFADVHRLGRRSRLHATVAEELYGIPPERRDRQRRSRLRLPRDRGRQRRPVQVRATDFFDDGPRSRSASGAASGRRPVLAVGNSNGDLADAPLRPAARPQPALRCSSLHDDPDREFDYIAGAEEALDRAADAGWTVVSIKNDWTTVFADAG